MPLPGFLVNIAQCQRRLGDLKTARATYREFVLVAPDSRLVPEVETLVKQLDTLIANLAAGGSGEAAAEVGGGGADVHATDPSAPALSRRPRAPGATEASRRLRGWSPSRRRSPRRQRGLVRTPAGGSGAASRSRPSSAV